MGLLYDLSTSQHCGSSVRVSWNVSWTANPRLSILIAHYHENVQKGIKHVVHLLLLRFASICNCCSAPSHAFTLVQGSLSIVIDFQGFGSVQVREWKSTSGRQGPSGADTRTHTCGTNENHDARYAFHQKIPVYQTYIWVICNISNGLSWMPKSCKTLRILDCFSSLCRNIDNIFGEISDILTQDVILRTHSAWQRDWVLRSR